MLEWKPFMWKNTGFFFQNETKPQEKLPFIMRPASVCFFFVAVRRVERLFAT